MHGGSRRPETHVAGSASLWTYLEAFGLGLEKVANYPIVYLAALRVHCASAWMGGKGGRMVNTATR